MDTTPARIEDTVADRYVRPDRFTEKVMNPLAAGWPVMASACWGRASCGSSVATAGGSARTW